MGQRWPMIATWQKNIIHSYARSVRAMPDRDFEEAIRLILAEFTYVQLRNVATWVEDESNRTRT
jgi:hypothetical protein